MVKLKIITILKVFILLFFLLFLPTLFYYATIYREDIENLPLVEDGVFDLTDYEIIDRSNIVVPMGEIQFFYNEWIVSDDKNTYNEEEMIYISLPDRWTGYNYNGTTLSKYGYASYRYYIKGIDIGTELDLYLPTRNAYRCYINKKLIAEVGNVSKTDIDLMPEYHFTDSFIVSDDILTEDGLLEVIVEIGYNDSGGVWELPTIKNNENYNYNDESLDRIVSIVCLILIVCLLGFSIVLAVMNKVYIDTEPLNNKEYKMYKTKNIAPNLALCFLIFDILLALIFSNDMIEFLLNFNVFCPETIFEKIYFINSVILFMILHIYFDYQTSPNNIFKDHKKLNLISIVINILSIILYLILYGTQYLIVSYILLLLAQVPYIFMLIKRYIKPVEVVSIYSDNSKIIYYLWLCLDFILISNTITVMLYNCDITLSVCTTFYSIHILNMCLIIYSITIYQMVLLNRVFNIARIQLLNKSLNSHNLNNMMNSLVETLECRKNLETSYDELLDNVNSHINNFNEVIEYCKIRQKFYIPAGMTNENNILISIEEECNFEKRFIEVYNISNATNFSITFNLEYKDFKVPAFLFEPIIQNACKHGNKDDINISINTSYNFNLVNIVIENDGEAFDLDKIHNSKGLGIWGFTRLVAYFFKTIVKFIPANSNNNFKNQIVVQFKPRKKEHD